MKVVLVKNIQMIKKPYWRIIIPGVCLSIVLFFSYAVCSPGKDITDGRYDLGTNGIWIQHGWLGDDAWFEKYNKAERKAHFRNEKNIQKLAQILQEHHITYVYPHMCPADEKGNLPGIDEEQVKRFLGIFKGFQILP